MSYLGLRKSKRHHWKADAPTMSDCLVRVLVRWHHWAIFLRNWARSRRYGQWRALTCHAQRTFVSKTWRGWHGRHLVSTGRGHLPHGQRNNRSFAHRFWKSNNQPKFWCPLAVSELRFDPVELFFVGTIEASKHEIKVAIHGIEVQTIENVLKNWVDWMGYCKASRGSHLKYAVFHS